MLGYSQDKQEDVNKMIREVINVDMDKSMFKTGTAAGTAADTGSSSIPAPASELAKRAQVWMDAKPTAYTKSNCANNGKGVTCQVSFPYKLKELNPTDFVNGDITMTVTIEAKDGKYRYTINNIKHKAEVAESSGGDIYSPVPECGSLKIKDLTWKHIKGAALADAKMVADDLKAIMAKYSGDAPKKDDW